MTWIGDIDENVYLYDNVARVARIFTMGNSEALFLIKLSKYEYIDFLRAIAQFPAFCSEYDAASDEPDLQDTDTACKRELATLFAHMTFETGRVNHFTLPYT